MACDVSMRTPYKKVVEDLLDNLSKTVLIVLAIALGVFGLAVILDTYWISNREIKSSYEATNPASISFSIQNPDEELFGLLENNPAVEDVEKRQFIPARTITTTDTWYLTKLYVVEDFKEQRVSTSYTLAGKAIPGRGEIVLENTSFSVLNMSIGDTLSLKLPGSPPLQLSIVGSVQADGTNPAWMHEEVIGYINKDSFEMFETTEASCRYLASIGGFPSDEATVLSVINDMIAELEQHGYLVQYLIVYASGSHPNAQQMSAILLLFRIFGALAILLSGILTFCMVQATLKRQTRQIAILKALGASPGRISLMYYLSVAIIGVIAATASIPTAKAIADLLSDFISRILVFTISDYALPLWLYLFQFALAVLFPIIMATIPIQKSCVVPVHEGLHDVGIDSVAPNARAIERLGNTFALRSTGISLGLRNAFRRTSRLLLVVFTLAVGGATFMASVNVQASLKESFANTLASFQMDSEFVLSEDYPDSDVAIALSGVEGIESFSTHLVTYASLLDEGEGNYSKILYDNSPNVKVVTIANRPSADPSDTYQSIERAFEEGGIDVISSITTAKAAIMFEKHLYTIAAFLVGASTMVIVVGTISLVSLAGLNAYDRKRESGIMRAFGAGTHSLFLITLTENLLTGLLGFVLSILLAIPLSLAIGGQFGSIFLGSALPLVFSFKGLSTWLLLSILICTVVSAVIVRTAVNKPVNEILALE